MDLVMLHFVDPGKMTQLNRGLVPPVIAAHERVAQRYGVPSINLALEVTERIQSGEFTWKDDFKNLHPSPFGQRLYARSVGRLLDEAWSAPAATEADGNHALPGPVDPSCYSRGKLVPVSAATRGADWTIEPSWTPADGKGTRRGFVRVPMLTTSKAGAGLVLPFTGTAVGVLVTAGPDAGVIESRVDGGPWNRTDLITQWSGGLHLPWSHVLHAGLDAAPHRLELRLASDQPRPSDGPSARIAWFLVNEAPAR